METITATKVVLCDDDAVLRSVIARMLEEQGYVVAAEADTADLGRYEIDRTEPGLVVLDLALRAGKGEQLLAELRATRPRTKVVVFSSYVADPMRLLDAGATAVVEKPDFLRLEEVLGLLAADELQSDKRRPVARALPALPAPTALSVSGLEPWASFLDVLPHLQVGDSLLVFDVAPIGSLAGAWDDVFRVDYRLALARAAAANRRPADRVSITPEGMPVMAVVHGHPEAAGAVFGRIEAQWGREVAAGVPLCAFTHVRAGERVDAERITAGVSTLLRDVDAAYPLRMY